MNQEMIAMILSLIGMTVNILSFQARKKKILFLFQVTGSAIFLLSYCFSDGGIAVALNCLFILRGILLIVLGERKKKPLAFGLMAGYLLSYMGVLLLQSPAPLEILRLSLPVIGAFLGTIGFIQTDIRTLRYWKMGDSVCWLIFNATIGLGALGGILCEIFSLCSILISLWRFRKKDEA